MRWLVDWTRRLHVYVGLYFLLLLWLLSVSGLVLNHSGWKFAEFWPQREQKHFEREVRASGGLEARNVMAQIGIRGEVEWPAGPQETGRLRFRANRPGHSHEVNVDAISGLARVDETAVNFWGVMSGLHHFNGVHAGDSRNGRDWFWTHVWVLSMDGLAAGLLFVSASGICFWWLTGRRRIAGGLALAAGTALCVVVLLTV